MCLSWNHVRLQITIKRSVNVRHSVKFKFEIKAMMV